MQHSQVRLPSHLSLIASYFAAQLSLQLSQADLQSYSKMFSTLNEAVLEERKVGTTSGSYDEREAT